MEWVEKDVEDFLVEHPGAIECDEVFGRQVQLGVGIADMVALRVDPDGERGHIASICVVEIKRDRIECAAVGQVQRYINAFKALAVAFWDEADGVDSRASVLIKGILVGSDIDHDALLLAEALGYEYRRYTPQFSVATERRYTVKPQNWLKPDNLQTLEGTVRKLGRWVVEGTAHLPEMVLGEDDPDVPDDSDPADEDAGAGGQDEQPEVPIDGDGSDSEEADQPIGDSQRPVA